jgi:hypothetical protein
MFYIKRVRNQIGLEYECLGSDSWLHYLVLSMAWQVRTHWKKQTTGQKLIDPSTGEEAQYALTEFSPSFMARMIPRWGPDSWGHACSAELKRGNLELIRTVGNEKFYRATDIGANLAWNTTRHLHFLLLKMKERLLIHSHSDGIRLIMSK